MREEVGDKTGIGLRIVRLVGLAVTEKIDSRDAVADIAKDLVDPGVLPSVAERATPAVNQNERLGDHGRLA